MTDQPDPYAPPQPGSAAAQQAQYAAAQPPASAQAGAAYAYGQPGYSPPPKNGLGTAALVLGIIGLVLFWTVILGFVLGVLALIFGIIGRKRANRHEATNGGMALAGAILGGLALAGSIALIAAGAVFFEHNKTAFHNYRDCVNAAQTNQDMQNCADTFRRSAG